MADSDIQLAKVVELFTKFSSKDGLLPTAYLKRIISTCCKTLSEADAARLVKAMDKEGLGKVPLGHFISWMFRTFEDQIEEWRTDEELEQFSKTLPSGLEQLGLSFICPDQFTDRGLELLGAGLPESLKTLALALEFSWTECKISSDGFGKLVAGLPKGLQSLDFSMRNDELGDEALELLARAMPPKLSKAIISFKDNDTFTDKGFCALISSFPKHLTELTLNFDGNSQVSDLTLYALSNWLARGTCLRKLQLIGNSTQKITKEGLQELCASLPSVHQLRLEFESSDAPEGELVVNPDESVAFIPKGI